MRLRTFNAPTMQEALALVKAELGLDAVILSTEQIGKAVKVTAGLDRDAILAAPEIAEALDPLDAISQALDFHRVPTPLADRLTQMAGNFLLESPVQALAGALRLRLPSQLITERRPTRPIMLVGLPGAGKTATLAKLLARAKLKDWPSIAITCDLVKAGAVEQLGTYTKALQVPAYRAKDAEMLKRAVAQAPAEAFVIIDTVGSNPLDSGDLDHLAALAASVQAEMVLVMAAGGCVVESGELAQLYAEIGVQRLVPTRIDAARRLGGILAACESGKLALAEFGTSPEIATGLEAVTAERLAAFILRTTLGPAQENDQTRPNATTRKTFGIRA
jgi:flagellar biosynthesis protein FlhF